MKIAFLCPHCSRENLGDPAAGPTPLCAHCRQPLPLTFTPSLLEQGIIDRCAVCGGDRFYVQKDFNRLLGVVIVAVGVGLSYALYGFNMAALVLGLSVCVAVDFILYKILPEVTVCYACHSIYREFTRNPQHKPFDLHIAEEYDHR